MSICNDHHMLGLNIVPCFIIFPFSSLRVVNIVQSPKEMPISLAVFIESLFTGTRFMFPMTSSSGTAFISGGSRETIVPKFLLPPCVRQQRQNEGISACQMLSETLPSGDGPVPLTLCPYLFFQLFFWPQILQPRQEQLPDGLSLPCLYQ